MPIFLTTERQLAAVLENMGETELTVDKIDPERRFAEIGPTK